MEEILKLHVTVQDVILTVLILSAVIVMFWPPHGNNHNHD